ncbi:MAG TPA: P-loop NTPase fold protein [Nitrososphaeraceae archaeon]|nr:P-loop NTPase fold protein [Nitrososphaeraceae archaeon]HKI09966.1 P-loop NTPase fold protein [Nitrososphaeraceae archaeon]
MNGNRSRIGNDNSKSATATSSDQVHSSSILRILPDDVDDKPIHYFTEYSNSIVNLITNPRVRKFSIGIFGEWGTGKSTLMRLTENKLNSFVNEEVFIWENIDQKSEIERLKSFIKDNYGADWIENSQVEKKDDEISFDYESDRKLSLQLEDKKDKASLILNGKHIGNFIVKKENDMLKLHLQQKKILTIWFDAWRYERDEQFALVPLMKTIAYKMDEQPKYEKAKEVLLKSIITALKGFASKYIVSEKYAEEFYTNLTSNIKALAEEDKGTIYFHGFKQIVDAMCKVLEDSPESRVVVFIDDLDRCSSKKALEVFESTKVFLDIEGFIFVVGLSHETLSKLISEEYKSIGLKGEDYLRKILQVNINIPKWEKTDIETLIQRYAKDLGEYGDKLNDQIISDLILTGVASNPRELKRSINRFMLSLSVKQPSSDSKSELDPTAVMVIQLLESMWSEFYRDLDSDEKFRGSVKDYAMNPVKRRIKLKMIRIFQKVRLPLLQRHDKLSNITTEMWDFLEKDINKIPNIFEDKELWKTYKDASAIGKDLTGEQIQSPKNFEEEILEQRRETSAR